jgi:hypothetical protein
MKLPFVSRSRHERELQMLEQAYAVRTDDLRQRLRSLIDKLTNISYTRYMGGKEIAVRIRISDMERQLMSPLEHKEYWWEIGRKITNSLEKEAQLDLYDDRDKVK